MACEAQQEKVTKLADELDLLREQCADGQHGACGHIAGVRTELNKATGALVACQQGLGRRVQPLPLPADPCASYRDKVIEIQGEIMDAQEDCHNGIHGQCGRIAGLRRELAAAEGSLRNCLHPTA